MRYLIKMLSVGLALLLFSQMSTSLVNADEIKNNTSLLNKITRKEAVTIAQQFLKDKYLDSEYRSKPSGISLDKKSKIWVVHFPKKTQSKEFISINVGLRVVISQDSGKIESWGPDK